MGEPGALRVTVAYAAAGVELIVAVDVPEGGTAADALTRSRLLEHPAVDADTVSLAIHGERAEPSTPLRDGDRVELVRGLLADPKDARHRRAQEKPLPRPRPRPRKRKSGKHRPEI